MVFLSQLQQTHHHVNPLNMGIMNIVVLIDWGSFTPLLTPPFLEQKAGLSGKYFFFLKSCEKQTCHYLKGKTLNVEFLKAFGWSMSYHVILYLPVASGTMRTNEYRLSLHCVWPASSAQTQRKHFWRISFFLGLYVQSVMMQFVLYGLRPNISSLRSHRTTLSKIFSSHLFGVESAP